MQYDIYLVNLDPRFGGEPDKTRPCIIVSPDELNRYLQTVVIIPLTTTIREWPFRPIIRYEGKKCDACVDQIRVIDKNRLMQKKGKLNIEEIRTIKNVIKEAYID